MLPPELQISLSYQWHLQAELRKINITTHGPKDCLMFHCPETNTFVMRPEATLPIDAFKYDKSNYLDVQNHLIFFGYRSKGVFCSLIATKTVFPEKIREAFHNFGFADPVEMEQGAESIIVRLSERDTFLLGLRKGVY